MKYLALLLIFGFGLSGSLGQTIKSLGYNTTNGQVVANTAELKFTNETTFGGLSLNTPNGLIFIPDLDGAEDVFYFDTGSEGADAQRARANLGFSTNLNTLWTATNASDARSAVNVAPTPIFKVLTNDLSITNQTNMTVVNGLTITTEANKNYTFELLPILSANSGSTIMQIVGSNATVYGYWLGQNVAVISTNSLTNEFSVSIASARSFFQKFHVITGTNSGSISFQFKNSTNNNTNTIGAGSYMMAQEILVTP